MNILYIIAVLIRLGLLNSTEEWNTKTPAEKQQLEYIITDFVGTGKT
jgi:hypothetical protein